jgi:SAM-dependent methyltransferase
MEVKRRKLQGVLNILSFNRHFYFFGVGMLCLLFSSRFFIAWNDILFWTVIAAFLYGLIMPLIVSAYVYDFSGYYNFRWLSKVVRSITNPSLIVNINAGFDETSFILENQFPSALLKVYDFYDSKKHTEPAIVRARNVSLVYPNTKEVSTDHLPLENETADIIFLLSAAHEIRSNNEKSTFLKECRRVLKKDGAVIMVEHLRDIPNFLAFSVGFTHFFSRSTWKTAFSEAGFSSFEETKFTPFMSIFRCTP